MKPRINTSCHEKENKVIKLRWLNFIEVDKNEQRKFGLRKIKER